MAAFSVGVSVVGGMNVFLINKGVYLPAEGSDTRQTVSDNQAQMTFAVNAGEHILSELNEPIGKVTLTGIPAKKAREVFAQIHVTMTVDGLLKFSARESSTGTVVNAEFKAKTDFTDIAKPTFTGDLRAEKDRTEANRRRAEFRLQLVRAAQVQSPSSDFAGARKRWRAWFEANPYADYDELQRKRTEFHREFARLLPAVWSPPTWRESLTKADLKYRGLWPQSRVTSVTTGTALVRFCIARTHSDVFCSVRDALEVRKEPTWVNVAIVDLDPHRVEVFASITFHENGVFLVRPSMVGPDGGVFQLDEFVFNVVGAPGQWQSGLSHVPEKRILASIDTQDLKVKPSANVLCTDKGQVVVEFFEKRKLKKAPVFGVEGAGGYAPVAQQPSLTDLAKRGDLVGSSVKIALPGPGAYQVFYYVEGGERQVARQLILYGSPPTRPQPNARQEDAVAQALAAPGP